MGGIRVAGTNTLTRRPSEHYAAHFAAVAAPLRSLVEEFIDGDIARPDGRRLDIVPITKRPEYARVALFDLLPTVDLCFVVDVWARSDPDPVGDWDSRGTPRLLDAVVSDGEWQLFNCLIALWPWSGRRLRKGEYPD